MLGGDVDLTSEKTRPTNTKNWVWSKFNVPLKSMIGDQLKPYTHSQKTVILSTDEPPENIIPVNNENHNVLFGNDAEPFISIIYKDDGKVVWKNVPTPLRLYGYQGGVRIDNFRYFLCGGLFFSRKKIARDAYLYNSSTHQVEKLMKMLGVRYTMNIVYLKNYVYVLGGRSYGSDSEGILQSCERFNLELKSWDVIAPMNYSRCTAMSFVIDNRIYIAGGYKGNMLRETKFEFYDETLNSWNLLAVELTEPLEASLVVSLENKVAFLGGRNKLGDSSGALIYDFTYGIDTMHLESKSNLITKKCLHKAIKLDQKQILLLGGENFEQSFFEFITIDDCKGVISNPVDLVSKNKVTIAKNIKNEIMNNVKDSKLHKYCFL